ncbi:hypothetical protein ATANTOWER_005449 [Ataeniobius toweri]|uniref:Uncharacterized protein n=1 Tax=Ataeniobius toweri TaxID=208326 RepID=A0ABU7C015_9TELE|nr:hypothetical protein [Ataeniobius toweri]
MALDVDVVFLMETVDFPFRCRCDALLSLLRRGKTKGTVHCEPCLVFMLACKPIEPACLAHRSSKTQLFF